MTKRFFSVREVAELLSLSRTSTYGLIRNHALPSVTIAGTVRIPAAAVATFADCLEAQAMASQGQS